MYRIIFCTVLLVLNLSIPSSLSAQSGKDSNTNIDSVSSQVKNIKNKIIQLLDFKNTEIKDIIRGLAAKYNLNIFIDDDIRQRATFRLSNVPLIDVLHFIVNEYGLEMTVQGNIYKIFLPEIPEPEPVPIQVFFRNDSLTIDVQDENIEKVIRAISEISGKNIILENSVSGEVTGLLQGIPFELGLVSLIDSNGFQIRKIKDIYIISKPQKNNSESSGNNYWIDVTDSLISLDVKEANLSNLIYDISSQMGVDIFVYGILKGQINAHFSNLPFNSVLDFLLKGTNYTYRQDGNIYHVGDKKVSGIASMKLIRLNHISVEGILDILPSSITSNATIKIVKEHNGLMVVGSRDIIQEIETFINQIDHPIAQILFEVLVVDYNSSDIGEFGITAGQNIFGDSTGSADQYFPTIDITASGKTLNKHIQFLGPKIGLNNIGKLSDDFYVRLRALEREGKANIRSRPQIATLNGHPASIKIGTTQYYILESQQPIVGGNQVFNQVTQRFEKITAEISLTITPWVSASGEITTEIRPEFSTPQGSLDSNIPPTINHRILNSTVRLRDGETIVLGGLTQTIDNETISKLPILGSLPILGRLFQNRSHNRSKAELIIYITPHLSFGDENNQAGIIK